MKSTCILRFTTQEYIIAQEIKKKKKFNYLHDQPCRNPKIVFRLTAYRKWFISLQSSIQSLVLHLILTKPGSDLTLPYCAPASRIATFSCPGSGSDIVLSFWTTWPLIHEPIPATLLRFAAIFRFTSRGLHEFEKTLLRILLSQRSNPNVYEAFPDTSGDSSIWRLATRLKKVYSVTNIYGSWPRSASNKILRCHDSTSVK